MNVRVLNMGAIRYLGEFLFISTNISLHQYNVSNSRRINHVSHNPVSANERSAFNIDFISDGSLVESSTGNSEYIFIYKFNGNYMCGSFANETCTTCDVGYTLTANICVDKRAEIFANSQNGSVIVPDP